MSSMTTGSTADSVRKNIQQMLDGTERRHVQQQVSQRSHDLRADVMTANNQLLVKKEAQSPQEKPALPAGKAPQNPTGKDISLIALLTEVITLQVKMSSDFWSTLWKNTQNSMDSMLSSGQASAVATKSALDSEAKQLFAQAQGSFAGSIVAMGFGAVALGTDVATGELGKLASAGAEDKAAADILTEAKTPEQALAAAKQIEQEVPAGALGVESAPAELEAMEPEAAQTALNQLGEEKQALSTAVKKLKNARDIAQKGIDECKEDSSEIKEKLEQKVKELNRRIEGGELNLRQIETREQAIARKFSSRVADLKITNVKEIEQKAEGKVSGLLNKVSNHFRGLNTKTKGFGFGARALGTFLTQSAHFTKLFSPLCSYPAAVVAKKAKQDQADAQALSKTQDTQQQWSSSSFGKQEEIRQQAAAFITSVVQTLNEAINSMSSTAQSLFRG